MLLSRYDESGIIEENGLALAEVVSDYFDDSTYSLDTSRSYVQGRVVYVVDGDSIHLKIGREKHKVRLTGIDTPESNQPWGYEAGEALEEKIAGKKVIVYTNGTDRYGRVLGEIHFKGRNINHEMVIDGHAWDYRKYMTDRSWLHDEKAARK